MEFNEKLQELRKSRSMTQEELAEALFVSRTAISKWEQGRGYPSLDSLKEISRFFSVSIDDLICSLIISKPSTKLPNMEKATELLRSDYDPVTGAMSPNKKFKERNILPDMKVVLRRAEQVKH